MLCLHSCVCVFSSARKWWWHVGVTGCPITQAYFTSLPSRQLNSTLVKLWGWTRRGSGKMRRSGVEFGRMDRQTAHQLCPGSLKSLYWNGNVGQKKHQPATAASNSSSSRAPSSHITASDLFEPLTIVPLKMVLDRPEKQHAGTSGMQYVYVSPDSRSCLYTKWWTKVFN